MGYIVRFHVTGSREVATRALERIAERRGYSVWLPDGWDGGDIDGLAVEADIPGARRVDAIAAFREVATPGVIHGGDLALIQLGDDDPPEPTGRRSPLDG